MIYLRTEYESVEWDNERGGIVIVRLERVDTQDAQKIEDVRKSLQGELEQTVKQIKGLKQKALKIKETLDKLNEKVGLISPTSELLE